MSNDKPTIQKNDFAEFERLSPITLDTLENNKTNETTASEINLLSISFSFNFNYQGSGLRNFYINKFKIN